MHTDRFTGTASDVVRTLRWRGASAQPARPATLVDRCPTGVNFITSADDSPALGQVVHTSLGHGHDAPTDTRALVRRVVRLPGNLTLVAATFAEAFGAQQVARAA